MRWSPPLTRPGARGIPVSLGRRGTALALLGVLWIASGISTIVAPPSPSYILLAYWPTFRGLVWIATGLVALAYARRRAGDDAIGFLALYLMAAYRVLAYSVGFIHWLLPGDGGEPRGIVGALAWTASLVLIVLISGWAEPADHELTRPDDGSRS